jgi:hypothetical protein
MKTQSRDTHPKIEQMLIEGIRRMSAAEKFRRIEELNQFLETLVLSNVRRHHPEADEWECRLRIASRRMPAELMQKAFGWDVKEKGY